jgi:hypothetical protein
MLMDNEEEVDLVLMRYFLYSTRFVRERKSVILNQNFPDLDLVISISKEKTTFP